MGLIIARQNCRTAADRIVLLRRSCILACQRLTVRDSAPVVVGVMVHLYWASSGHLNVQPRTSCTVVSCLFQRLGCNVYVRYLTKMVAGDDGGENCLERLCFCRRKRPIIKNSAMRASKNRCLLSDLFQISLCRQEEFKRFQRTSCRGGST